MGPQTGGPAGTGAADGAEQDHPGYDEAMDGFSLPSVPDGFQRLWVPHRLAYIANNSSEDEECPFCATPGLDDERGLIVHRGETCFVVLNLFPYNSGHVLVCPYRHVADYTDLTVEETAELAALTQQAMRVLRKVSRPGGFNLGMNQGVLGGAGIAEHLHQHVVPRWRGDANFLPIIAQTKAIAQVHHEVRAALSAAWGDA